MLESLAASNSNENQALLNAAQSDIDPEDLFHEPTSTLFDSLLQHNSLTTAMGFVEAEVMSLYHLLQPFIVIVRQPGSRPKSTWLDMLVCYLAWLKLGVEYDVLAIALGDITSS